jgi:ribosome-binding protein aMBF1 (putative translation factor)
MRLERKRRRIGLSQVAQKLGMPAKVLHDLEHGRQSWTRELVDRYQRALAQCL